MALGLLSSLGAITAAYLAIRFSLFVYLFVRPSSLPRYLKSSKKAWALVTGASDGIGKGFAEELCHRGFNVIIHGRNPSKLLTVKESLKREFPNVQVRVVVLDAHQFTEATMDELVRSIENVHLKVLVNNVGGLTAILGDTEFQSLDSYTADEVDQVITMNATFPTQLTRKLLPVLARNAPGLIINIGSQAERGLPWLCIYGGTKSYMNAFSRALRTETKADGRDVEVIGIRVASVQAGGNRAQVSLLVPTSRVMAAAALDRVGCGKANVSAYFPHAVQNAFADLLPETLLDRFVIKRLTDLAGDSLKSR